MRDPDLAAIATGPARADHLPVDDDLHAEALALLRAHGAMGEAREYVLGLAREAVQQLDVLPESPAKDALVAFAELIATRTA